VQKRRDTWVRAGVIDPCTRRQRSPIGRLLSGHRGVSFTSTAGTADEFGPAMADSSQRVDLPDARYTTSTAMTSGEWGASSA
jgi:hypothetical protein